jgi:methionyl-tRNA synthetase
MASRYCEGKVPKISSEASTNSNILVTKGKELAHPVQTAYESLDFSKACEAIFGLIRSSNKYLDETAPWTLFKQGKQTETELVLYTVFEAVRLASYLLSPITPDLANKIYSQLGFSGNFNHSDTEANFPFKEHSQWGTLPPGQKLGKAEPIFQRIDTEV